jgi:hypothetical protein
MLSDSLNRRDTSPSSPEHTIFSRNGTQWHRLKGVNRILRFPILPIRMVLLIKLLKFKWSVGINYMESPHFQTIKFSCYFLKNLVLDIILLCTARPLSFVPFRPVSNYSLKISNSQLLNPKSREFRFFNFFKILKFSFQPLEFGRNSIFFTF